MKSNWPTVRLGELVEVKHGWPFKSQLFSKQRSGKGIVVSIGNFRYTGGFRFEETDTKEYRGTYPPEYELQAEDLLLVMTCQTSGGEILGIPGRIPDDGNTYLHNQRLGKVIINRPQLVRLDYLYWLFLTPDFNRHLVATASGTKILHTAPSRICDYSFRLPPLAVQAEIAETLSAINDRIDMLRLMNKTLEALAKAIYKSWFIDFDPVWARTAGREPEGMDAGTATLFPSTFEESELGPVPKGWSASTIGQTFELTMGQSPPGETYNELGEGVPFYQGRSDFGFRFPRIRVFSTKPTRFAKANDTLVSVRAPVGSINVALEDCSIGRGVAAVHHEMAPSFAFYSMWGLGAQFAQFEGEGTVFGSINKKQFEALPINAPPPSLVGLFEDTVNPIDKRIQTNELHARSLTEVRDALLPRLMSGQLRVAEAEEVVAEALA